MTENNRVERRNDIGLKFIYVLLTALITLLLTVFFNKTYELAESSNILANENRKDIAVLGQCFKDVDRRLEGMDLKLDRIIVLNHKK